LWIFICRAWLICPCPNIFLNCRQVIKWSKCNCSRPVKFYEQFNHLHFKNYFGLGGSVNIDYICTLFDWGSDVCTGLFWKDWNYTTKLRSFNMPMAAIFAEDAALALASELAPYAAGEAALAASSLLGAEALMGLGAEALGTSAIGGAEALAASEAMAANAAAGGAGAGQAGINAAQVAAQQEAATQMATRGLASVPEVMSPAQQAYQTAANVTTSPVSGFQPAPGFEGITSGPQGASPGFFNPSATVAPGQGPLPNPQFQIAPNASQGLRLGSSLESITPSGPISSVLNLPEPLLPINSFSISPKKAMRSVKSF
jgi:hypothetical protein